MSKVFGLLLALLLFIQAGPVSAQTVVTTRKLEPGEVVVKNESDGTVYLTTETVVSTDSATTTTRNTRVRSPLENVNIALPEGFAQNFSGLLNGVLSFVLVIAALLVFVFLIWGALDWITSGGDKGKTEKAREKITSAIIGLIIIASSYAILTLALRFLGFNGINEVFDNAGTIQGGAPQASPVPTPTPTPTPITILK